MSNLNDPRVLFAAERTLLAWNRTSLSLMAFGFVVERFGIFMQMIGKPHTATFQREMSFFIGAAFIILAIATSIYSIIQYRKVISTLTPAEIPKGYSVWGGAVVNASFTFLGIALTFYLIRGVQ